MSKQKLTCPKCGATMNHHADKPNQAIASDASGLSNSAGSEIKDILEIHFCASCGNTEVRQSS